MKKSMVATICNSLGSEKEPPPEPAMNLGYPLIEKSSYTDLGACIGGFVQRSNMEGGHESIHNLSWCVWKPRPCH